MDKWDLHVEKISNGYIARFIDENDDGGKFLRTVVFEILENEDAELETMKGLLWFIMEHFGIYYSKHNNKNLVPEIKGGENEKLH